jgi:hypothetical protein
MAECCSEWIAEEFKSVDFGDERLFARFQLTAQRLSNSPQGNIGEACAGSAETKGAYRMFANDAINPEEMIFSHQIKTLERMQSHKVFLAVQDTTYLDFNSHNKTEGLGTIGKRHSSEVRGLIMHSALLFTVEGMPLGLASHRIWARPNRKTGDRTEQKARVKEFPIEEKESFKWLSALDDTLSMKKDAQKIVTIGDRESDVFEFICKADQSHTSFVIRNCFNRKKSDGEYIRESLAEEKWQGSHEIAIPSRGGRKARNAQVGIRFKKMTLSPSMRTKKAQSKTVKVNSVDVTVIEVKELATDREDKLHWYLLTNEPVASYNDAREKIHWYEMRWPIEIYHKILKSGCKIEDCRLQTAEKLTRYITLMSVVAVRLYQLTMAGRTEPNSPCENYLSEKEWRLLFSYFNRDKSVPAKSPTTEDAVRWIGMLGGHQGRKSDGPPGIVVIWRGWQKLQNSLSMWEAMHALK